MDIVLLLVVWIALGAVAGAIAQSKGNSFASAFWISFLLSPAIGIVIALVQRPNEVVLEKRRLETGESRKCPFCAEVIKKEATVCRYCGRDLPEPATATAPGDQPELARELGYWTVNVAATATPPADLPEPATATAPGDQPELARELGYRTVNVAATATPPASVPKMRFSRTDIWIMVSVGIAVVILVPVIWLAKDDSKTPQPSFHGLVESTTVSPTKFVTTKQAISLGADSIPTGTQLEVVSVSREDDPIVYVRYGVGVYGIPISATDLK